MVRRSDWVEARGVGEEMRDGMLRKLLRYEITLSFAPQFCWDFVGGYEGIWGIVGIWGMQANGEQARAKAAAKPTGKLGKQLNAQKMQGRTDTLQEASRQEVARRDADATAAVRSYN